MSLDNVDNLKDLCKDEDCFKELKEIIGEIVDEKDQKATCLSLLESAISNDYDSILITELSLEKPGPKIVYVNDGFCEMTGYSKEEVIGKTPRILQGPKTDPKVLEKLKSRLKNGQCFFGQTINYRKDGSEFVNQWDIHPITDKEGNPTHWVSYQHDISERKRVEKQLIDTKIEFDDLREEVHCTTIDVNLEGVIISANQAFCALTGYKKEELRQKKVWALFPEKYAQSLKNRFEQPVSEQTLTGLDLKGVIKHKSGVPIQIKGKTQLLNLRDKKVVRAEIQNISLQKKIVDSLQKCKNELGQKLDIETS
ncbi:PAS domain-containing protein [Fodinibius salsisoli]|uniref:PAS domain S-box protein n=1 Tax=Fodinibius salsisoli TaxID=2820877 RepID=A0ABT3PSD3_9BACT|nr:PAS domain S-box protein [Fodinibius salsisoli]MCW9708768.1 PAS domain S-box protein [Fodinibius salsisoli]